MMATDLPRGSLRPCRELETCPRADVATAHRDVHPFPWRLGNLCQMTQRTCLTHGAWDGAADASLQQTWADLPPPAAFPPTRGRGHQLSEAHVPLLLFSREGGVGVLKAGRQLRKGSLHPKIQGPPLQTPALVFALRPFVPEGAGEGDQSCEGQSPIRRE